MNYRKKEQWERFYDAIFIHFVSFFKLPLIVVVDSILNPHSIFQDTV
jgi:hypothetical protein